MKYKFIGEAIKNSRECQGMKQSTLSKLSGQTQAYISQIEKGHKRSNLETLNNLTTVLGIELIDIMHTAEKIERIEALIPHATVMHKALINIQTRLASEEWTNDDFDYIRKLIALTLKGIK